MMLHGRNNDFVPGLQGISPKTLCHQIDPFCGTFGKDDFLPFGSVDKTGCQLAGSLKSIGSTVCKRMHAPVNICIVKFVIMQQCVNYSPAVDALRPDQDDAAAMFV